MLIKTLDIPEVKLITQFRANDERGAFVKTFHQSTFQEHGLSFNLKESFYSTSKKDVIRGMHFHTAPNEHAKIVFCTHGSILDIALDIRKQSPTFGQYVEQILSFDNNNAMYIPKGFAHGFITLSHEATTFYLVDGEYHKESDAGILYNSFGKDWATYNPIISSRDLTFPSLSQYHQTL